VDDVCGQEEYIRQVLEAYRKTPANSVRTAAGSRIHSGHGRLLTSNRDHSLTTDNHLPLQYFTGTPLSRIVEASGHQ
jgi:hypothetical protein